MSELRVLIVEDERDAAEIIESLLSHYQLQTVLARSAEEAQAALETNQFDALVVDMFLPNMDGIELIKWIRLNPQTAHLPCIAITAYNSSALRHQALNAGYDRYFSKPVNHDELIDTLRTFLA
jgi:CheY-like chemotaxis protein